MIIWLLFNVFNVAELIVSLDVPNVYPFFPLCSHLNNGSKNIRKRYGLSVSSCKIPLCIGMGFVFPKFSGEYGIGI